MFANFKKTMPIMVITVTLKRKQLPRLWLKLKQILTLTRITRPKTSARVVEKISRKLSRRLNLGHQNTRLLMKFQMTIFLNNTISEILMALISVTLSVTKGLVALAILYRSLRL
jgi:hypothetical protein